jgi:hypothetical protein
VDGVIDRTAIDDFVSDSGAHGQYARTLPSKQNAAFSGLLSITDAAKIIETIIIVS